MKKKKQENLGNVFVFKFDNGSIYSNTRNYKTVLIMQNVHFLYCPKDTNTANMEMTFSQNSKEYNILK